MLQVHSSIPARGENVRWSERALLALLVGIMFIHLIRTFTEETLFRERSISFVGLLRKCFGVHSVIRRSRVRSHHPRFRQYSIVETDHEIFSMVILSPSLIKEGQLSVSGERKCTSFVQLLRGESQSMTNLVR